MFYEVLSKVSDKMDTLGDVLDTVQTRFGKLELKRKKICLLPIPSYKKAKFTKIKREVELVNEISVSIILA